MGMLERRLLNFENIFIISMNEGILPKGKINNSYIPFEVKRNLDFRHILRKMQFFHIISFTNQKCKKGYYKL